MNQSGNHKYRHAGPVPASSKKLASLDYAHRPWRAPCGPACGCSNPLPADLSGIRRYDDHLDTFLYNRSLDGMKWNPGSLFPDYAALHPGCNH
jgi:hypothetical protein